uniref:Integrin, alpha 5 (fibronectin receptor, alpha polypeptide) n=1 Tax=Salmo trutta TaxID=8032 RepID=A0A673WQ05_SALTR
MGSKKYHSKTPGKLNYSLFCIGFCLIILLPLCDTFNLDVENPSVYSGPNGSYFGYSVEFYLTNSSRPRPSHICSVKSQQQHEQQSSLPSMTSS